MFLFLLCNWRKGITSKFRSLDEGNNDIEFFLETADLSDKRKKENLLQIQIMQVQSQVLGDAGGGTVNFSNQDFRAKKT